MAATPHTPIASAPVAALQTLLSKERDAHRLQRELVRASLLYCPEKTLPRAA